MPSAVVHAFHTSATGALITFVTSMSGARGCAATGCMENTMIADSAARRIDVMVASHVGMVSDKA